MPYTSSLAKAARLAVSAFVLMGCLATAAAENSKPPLGNDYWVRLHKSSSSIAGCDVVPPSTFAKRASSDFAIPMTVHYEFDNTDFFHGLSVTLASAADLGALKDMPDMAEVFPVQTVKPPDAQLPEFHNPLPGARRTLTTAMAMTAPGPGGRICSQRWTRPRHSSPIRRRKLRSTLTVPIVRRAWLKSTGLGFVARASGWPSSIQASTTFTPLWVNVSVQAVRLLLVTISWATTTETLVYRLPSRILLPHVSMAFMELMELVRSILDKGDACIMH